MMLKPQHDILQPENHLSLFSTITFIRSAGRSQQPSRQENEQGVRAQGLCVQALVDRRGERGGRDTDLPTEQGWHNTQERGQQPQHVLSALGNCSPAASGHSTNETLIQTGPPLAPTRTQRHTLHGPPARKCLKPTARGWFFPAQCCGSPLEDQYYQTKHILGDSPGLTVTPCADPAMLRAALGILWRKADKERQHATCTTSCLNPEGKEQCLMAYQGRLNMFVSSSLWKE